MLELAAEVAAELRDRAETLAIAETSAGGLISAALAEVPGASAWLLGGAVAYGSAAKERWLGLHAADLGTTGAVSAEAARLMALGARNALGATWGLAETGIAGPQTGRRSTKPAGLAYLAICGPSEEVREVRTGLGYRGENQRAFATEALVLLLQSLRRAPHTAPEPETRSTPSPG
jgi:nicotinamide-nucleotide amidase